MTVINNDGTKANWFSSINSSKVSQSVVAPIMEAILLLAKENTGYGTGSCMNDKLIVAEYKNGEERYDVCVFNVDKKQIESVTIKVLSEKKTKAYILDNSTNSGVVIWLAIIQFLLINNEDLEKSFSDEQKEVFEKFHDCWSEYMSLGEAAIFEYAFKLGMQLAIETLTE